ncbi:EAL domain-containing protein [Thiohalobacter sp. IOR34]|uniref:EAL domain-containing protein n=1 Tax=Thiohalobacter sp. IOR34 TaxID=3057176 RepID=UPI0025AFDB42|nr:bifunctional diguanylate cyclase/phosphodiesterase [Thiohalobacter sp. IOR34]WJW74277.1 EAL domain-containing protein [Thiohalobacter sp. IOR34]
MTTPEKASTAGVAGALRLLLVACEGTARAVEQALEAGSMTVEMHRLTDRASLTDSLDAGDWQLILSELTLDDFDALDLLGELRQRELEVPLVLIAETGGEEIALRSLEAGVEHCLLHDADNLQRLPGLIRCLLARQEREREQRKVEAQLRRSRERYRDIFDNTSDLIQCLAPDGSFLYTNRAWREVMGYSEEEVARLNLLDVLHPDNVACCTDRFERLKQGQELESIEFKFLTKQGETVHLTGDCGSLIRDGEAVSTRGIFKNITEKVRAEAALRASEARYQALYENAPDIYTTIGAGGEILSINRTGAQMLGYAVDELIGTPVLQLVHPEDRPRVEAHLAEQFSHFTTDNSIEYRKLRKDGSILWVHQRVSLDPGAETPCLLVACRDVTERRMLEDRLAYQATHDALTNLINRPEFEHRLQRLLSSAQMLSRSEHVLCYLDLDQFKVVNDTCGHMAGDELLRQVAGLLVQQIRASDTLARLGGDEFAVLMEHCPLDQAEHLADRMREVIEGFRFQWRNRRFTIGVSIGVVPVLGNSASLEEIMSLADSACYAAKEQGRNRVHVCLPEDVTVPGQVGEMHWAPSLTEALEGDHFRLYAQPIEACCADSNGKRYEILLRLEEDGQVIRPGAFMPAAERYNLSTRLDRWVLENLLRWFGSNPRHLEELDVCSINLSALSLCDEGFRAHALELLDAANFPLHKLCFEVTETAAISNLSKATHFIDSLREAGCRFALDDFGSGLSSFAYLKNLPVDMIKIDGTFIKHIASNAVDRAMVRSIREIAAMMGKQVTAEYVESAEALDILREIGVDFVQGYHLGHPEPLERLEACSLGRLGSLSSRGN